MNKRKTAQAEIKTVKIKKVKPKWARILLRRRVFVIFMLLLQIALILCLFFTAGTQYAFAGPLLTVISYAAMLYIISVEDRPSYKLTWVVLILIFPFFGGMLYILIRLQTSAKKFKQRLSSIEEKSMPLLSQRSEVLSDVFEYDSDCFSLSRYLSCYIGFPVYKNSSIRYFASGEEKIDALLCELKKAKKFIFLEYFIIGEGIVWKSILDILKEKAKNGVDVRIIYDDIGCFMLLANNHVKALEGCGIKCITFNPFRPLLSTIQNNRDHRKIAVIDGKVGFTGGVNLADEYVNAIEKYGKWKDSAIQINGEAVWTLTVLFLQTWNIYRDDDHDFSVFKAETEEKKEAFCQPYGDRPLDNKRVGEHVFMSIINRANNYLYITTPYLIIEDGMSFALCEAARSGVDVKIITPHIPDKKYVHMTTRSYYGDLLSAGVEIYEYMPGFIHSKNFVSDDKTAVVGTTNLDYRSLYLHFECGALLHNCDAVFDIKKDFEQTLKACIKITPQTFKQNFATRFFQKILRLFAPFM